MNKEGLIEHIREIVEPLISEMDLNLVDIEYKREAGGWVLRVYIDKEGGVSLDDCANVSQEIGVLLDVRDIIPHSYNLEVSSPGLDRALKQTKDFLRYRGKKVKVRCFEPIGNRRNFTGTIKDVENEAVIIIDSEGKRWCIPLQNIEKARLVIDFN